MRRLRHHFGAGPVRHEKPPQLFPFGNHAFIGVGGFALTPARASACMCQVSSPLATWLVVHCPAARCDHIAQALPKTGQQGRVFTGQYHRRLNHLDTASPRFLAACVQRLKSVYRVVAALQIALILPRCRARSPSRPRKRSSTGRMSLSKPLLVPSGSFCTCCRNAASVFSAD